MKVAFVGYRGWSWMIKRNLEAYGFEFTSINKANVVLYYGWSWMISPKIYTKKRCLILHPSPLPKYRGGSPLQHQIINGETKSAVTIFQVTDKLDAGKIFTQTRLSLEGSLEDVLNRIVDIGTKDTIEILEFLKMGVVFAKEQKGKGTYYKRRKPEESELTLNDFKTKSAKELNNFIRALADPYPNAFIKIKGKKLYLTGSHL